MKRSRFSALFLAGLLCGCLSGTQQQLQQCTSVASARYPSGSAAPLGQPYKDIIACMHDASYEPDGTVKECRSLDYTVATLDAHCYRPAGTVPGFFHDMGAFFR